MLLHQGDDAGRVVLLPWGPQQGVWAPKKSLKPDKLIWGTVLFITIVSPGIQAQKQKYASSTLRKTLVPDFWRISRFMRSHGGSPDDPLGANQTLSGGFGVVYDEKKLEMRSLNCKKPSLGFPENYTKRNVSVHTSRAKFFTECYKIQKRLHKYPVIIGVITKSRNEAVLSGNV